ncbi:major facilitator superfamily domain-containing protein [Pyronema domesticum]|nr:major facilitator superfamily domain-containing protein [Pyronema domesticum]
MGLGILEDRHLAHVPGTAYMGAGSAVLPGGFQVETAEADRLDPRIKYDTTGKKPVVLIPQPSDDPNDPLNWSLFKRDVITTVLCIVSIMAATLGPLLAANTVALAFFWQRTFTDIALLTGYHLLGVGVAGFIFVPSARVWGKRHLYILGTVLLIASSIWGGAAKSYKSLLWARIIQGVAITPFEALVNASIGDLYPVHMRGKRMAFTNFALFGGAFFTPVIVGKMTRDMSWRWPFYFVGIFSAIMLPFVFFLVPETAYRRRINTDLASTEDILLQDLPSARGSEDPVVVPRDGEADKGMDGKATVPAPVSFAKSLALFNGRKTDENLFKLLLRPIPLLFHPAIFWGMLTQGTLIGWTVMIGVVLGIVFMGPPLWFNEVKTGYMYTGAFIGAALGFILSGLLSDFSAKWMAKRNKGVYEPEFRLILVIPQTIIGAIGLFGFGFTSANIAEYGQYLPTFFFGMEVMGMVLGATASALYLVDAHRDLSVESFTCLLLFKNFFSFAMTWYAVNWIAAAGVWEVFKWIGIVQILVGLLSVPMYVFGKRNRSLMHRYEILKMTQLK